MADGLPAEPLIPPASANAPGNVSQIASTQSHFATTHRDWIWEGGFSSGVLLVLGGDRLSRLLNPYWSKPERLDRLCAVIHLIFRRTQQYDDDFIPVSERLLSNYVGRDFASAALRFLTDIGCLETDRNYTPGQKCRGYRFSQEWRAEPFIPRAISRRIAHVFFRADHTKSISSIKTEVHEFLWRSLQTLGLPHHQLDSIKCEQDRSKRASLIWSAEAIRHHQWFFSVGEQSGRVFNNFTSLQKTLRRVATLSGKPCAEIDIRNSQPLFLAGIYPTQCAEAGLYREIVSTGVFYETVNEAAGHPFGADERDSLKKEVFKRILYGRHHATSRLWAGFQRLFPVLARLITDQKSRDYRALAVAMQRHEVRAIVDTLVPALARRHPGIPFLTVHDSLAVPLEIVDSAHELLIESVGKVAGTRPATNITLPS